MNVYSYHPCGEFQRSTLTHCERNAKYMVFHPANPKAMTKKVCGIHRKSLLKRGWEE